MKKTKFICPDTYPLDAGYICMTCPHPMCIKSDEFQKKKRRKKKTIRKT